MIVTRSLIHKDVKEALKNKKAVEEIYSNYFYKTPISEDNEIINKLESLDMADIVQIQDKKSKMYMKVDRETGRVLRKKTTLGPYKRIEIVKSIEIKGDKKCPLSSTLRVSLLALSAVALLLVLL